MFSVVLSAVQLVIGWPDLHAVFELRYLGNLCQLKMSFTVNEAFLAA